MTVSPSFEYVLFTFRRSAIHAEAPEFIDMSTEQEILVTGIKVVDLLAPYVKGGKIGKLLLSDQLNQVKKSNSFDFPQTLSFKFWQVSLMSSPSELKESCGRVTLLTDSVGYHTA